MEENEKARLREEEEKLRKKKAAEMVRNIQLQQIKENKEKNYYRLSERERELNKHILDEIDNNPDLKSELEGRIGVYESKPNTQYHPKESGIF